MDVSIWIHGDARLNSHPDVMFDLHFVILLPHSIEIVLERFASVFMIDGVPLLDMIFYFSVGPRIKLP